jgi:hypothetical protein
MATKTIYVDGVGGATDYYASLSAALSGHANKNLTTDNGTGTPGPLHVEISWTGEDTTGPVEPSGYTTDATNRLYIYTTTAARHAGKYSTSKYRLALSNAAKVFEATVNTTVTLDGLQFVLAAADRTCVMVRFYSNSIMANCIVKGANNNSFACTGVIFSGASKTHYLFNTVVYNIGTNSGSYAINCAADSGSTTYLYHCNAHINASTSPYNIRNAAAGTVVAKNCYAGGNTGYDYNGTITKTTCASSDTTGSAGVQSIAVNTTNFTNVTANGADEDYRLPGTGSALYDTGTDITADGAPFTTWAGTDVAGTTRTRWDIGFHEYYTDTGNRRRRLLLCGR